MLSFKLNDFNRTFTSILNHHTPKKKKVIRGNHKPHMKKEKRKVIMLRSKLRNKANETKMKVKIAAYKKQHNYIAHLNKEFKHNYFDSPDTKKGFKPFQNVYKPYFF